MCLTIVFLKLRFILDCVFDDEIPALENCVIKFCFAIITSIFSVHPQFL